MKANIGTVDRIVRIVVGLALLGAGCYFKNWFGLIGLLPILTAIFRFCPAYVPFGLSTCGVDKTPPAHS
jgi:hypothetical protein